LDAAKVNSRRHLQELERVVNPVGFIVLVQVGFCVEHPFCVLNVVSVEGTSFFLRGLKFQKFKPEVFEQLEVAGNQGHRNDSAHDLNSAYVLDHPRVLLVVFYFFAHLSDNVHAFPWKSAQQVLILVFAPTQSNSPSYAFADEADRHNCGEQPNEHCCQRH
jgi:hypothetical protein